MKMYVVKTIEQKLEAEMNYKWRDLAKCHGGFRCWHINGFRLGEIEIKTQRTFV
jgi:hypothetical protein